MAIMKLTKFYPQKSFLHPLVDMLKNQLHYVGPKSSINYALKSRRQNPNRIIKIPIFRYWRTDLLFIYLQHENRWSNKNISDPFS